MDNATSYLTIMLQDNEQLKNYLAGYLNNRLALKALHAPKPMENQEQYELRLAKEITDQERQGLINVTSLFRGYATRMETNINSLIRRINKEGEIKLDEVMLKEIEEDFAIIENTAAPEYKACKRFVQNINNFLEDNIDVGQVLGAGTPTETSNIPSPQ